jgi:hypothetical protein
MAESARAIHGFSDDAEFGGLLLDVSGCYVEKLQ